MRKILSMVFATIIFAFAMLSTPMVTYAVDESTLTVKSTNNYNQKTIVVEISSTAIDNVGGIILQINYDKDKMTYVENSVSVSSKLIGAQSNHLQNSNNVVMLWDTTANEGVQLNGSIMSMNFAMTENFSQDCVVNVVVKDLYSADIDSKSIGNNVTYINNNIGSMSSNINEVINIIDSIGDVEYNDSCLQKIVAAEQAYYNLKISERDLITNYQVLINARNIYDNLREENINGSDKTAVEAFKNTYSDILNKSVEDIKYTDKDAIDKAIESWNQLSSNVQKAMLINEKNLLNKFSTRLVELKKILDNEANEQLLKQEAQGYVDKFKKDFYWMENMKLDDVTIANKGGLQAASTALETYAQINTYTIKYLANEKKFVDEGLKKIAELAGATTESSNNIVSMFYKNYSSLLNMSPDDVTKSDESDIMVAYQLLMMMDPSDRATISDVVSHIEKLVAAIPNDSEEQTVSEDNADEVITKLVEVPKYKYGKNSINTSTIDNKIVSDKNNSDSILNDIKKFTILLCISIIGLGLSIFLYIYTNKNCREDEMNK